MLRSWGNWSAWKFELLKSGFLEVGRLSEAPVAISLVSFPLCIYGTAKTFISPLRQSGGCHKGSEYEGWQGLTMWGEFCHKLRGDKTWKGNFAPQAEGKRRRGGSATNWGETKRVGGEKGESRRWQGDTETTTSYLRLPGKRGRGRALSGAHITSSPPWVGGWVRDPCTHVALYPCTYCTMYHCTM